MSLNNALSIATSGLASLENSMSTVSQNIANAQTAGYINEGTSANSAVAGNMGTGVRIGPTTLNVNRYLQASLYGQNAGVASLQTMNQSLGAVASLQGTTSGNAGQTNTLSDNLGNLRSTLIALTSTPTNNGAQGTALNAARSLVTNINNLAAAYRDGRQAAEDHITANVQSINSDVTQIGALSKKITALKAQGMDTAPLENQRYQAMNHLSSFLSVSYTETSKGDMIITTDDGTQIPTRPDQINQKDSGIDLPSTTWPLSTESTTLTVDARHKDGDKTTGIPGIMLDGKDITSHLTGGTLGGNITLRDQTYPQMQAQLDSLSYTLVNRFNQSGLDLFSTTGKTLPSDPNKAYPDGIIGLSSALNVNPDYVKNPASLTTKEDGSTDTTKISNALNHAFSTDQADISGSLSAPSSNLGPDGDLSTSYSGEQGILQLASSLTSDQGSTIASISDNLNYHIAVQTTLQTKVSNISGVNVNNELAKTVTLNNAYLANAKILSTVQTMFNALINAF